VLTGPFPPAWPARTWPVPGWPVPGSAPGWPALGAAPWPELPCGGTVGWAGTGGCPDEGEFAGCGVPLAGHCVAALAPGLGAVLGDCCWLPATVPAGPAGAGLAAACC
jgi:hypothetical protein